ncbi:MAG: prepilin-type N-terminal cleavage/methylation domain-containing protein [gamma proteobacterium symbiont of Taylorina sp.]|nr:prepilin-type N-terminal cleavage/methylation domain-containing protein [gamma proteobacterium symbiont of Taylorina sp.]
MNKTIFFSQGATLIELIISIVIISIAVMGVSSLFVTTTRSSADPMIRAQQLAIAQSYMDEIMMQAYTPIANFSATGSCTSGSPIDSNRIQYNDVDDYNGLSDSSALDQNGCAIASLSNYSVAVTVTLCSTCGTKLNASAAKKIVVNVSHSSQGALPMTAYRTNY